MVMLSSALLPVILFFFFFISEGVFLSPLNFAAPRCYSIPENGRLGG